MYVGFTFVPQHTLTQHTILLYPLWMSLNKIDMMAGASCSLHLSLLYSDEIILSRAFHATAAFSIILYMKSDLVQFGAGAVQHSISSDQSSPICCCSFALMAIKKPKQPSPIYSSYFIQQYNFCSSEYNQYTIHNDKIYFK